MSNLSFPIPNGKIANIYDPKPRRTGAWVLGEPKLIFAECDKNCTDPDCLYIHGAAYKEIDWIYTANPENYRKGNKNQINHPFWITPDHMKVEN